MLYDKIVSLLKSRNYPVIGIWALILFFALVSYWPLFFQEAFWDDNNFVFNNDELLLAKNPFVYWDQSSGFTKAWPMGYTFLWSIQRITGNSIFLFHAICFLLHFLNGILIRQIVRPYLKELSWGVALFFIFHPMQVHTLFWAIQILSVLSLTFFLLALKLIFASEIKKKIGGGVLLVLSFATKPWVLLSAVLFLKDTGKLSSKKNILIGLAVLTCAVGYFFSMSRQGIHLRFLENKNEPFYYFDLNSRIQFQGEFSAKPTYYHAKVLMDQGQQFRLSFPERAMMKLVTIGNSFSFYFQKTFLIGKQTLIYPKKILADAETALGLLLLGIVFILATLWFFNLLSSQYWFLGFSSVMLIVTYLPVSGVIYIPQMKFNLVSDHWYYLQAFGYGSFIAALIQIVYLRFKFNPYFFTLVIPFFLVVYYKNYTYVRYFSDRVQMLEENLKINPNSIIVQELLKIEHGSVSN